MRGLLLLLLVALVVGGGCRGNQQTTKPDAPKEGAPREKVAIEAPAGGSAKDAKVSSVEKQQMSPPTADPNRAYQAGATERDLGLPFYPKSEELRAGGRLTDSTGTTVQVFRKTKDPVADVIAFYRKRLDVVLHEIVDATSTTLVGETKGMQVTVIAVKKPDGTEVNVFTKRSGKR